jgi:hypothetical protein
VEVTFEPDGVGGTLITLVHSGLPLLAVDMHRDAWTHYVGRLVVRAEGGDPGLDPTAA